MTYYAQRIKAIAEDRRISIASAKIYYRTVVKNDRFRIKRYSVVDARSKPRYVSLEKFRKEAKLVSKGKEKGRYIFYVDTLMEKILDARQALYMRKILMINRFTIWLQSIPKSAQRAFLKFWPKRALKRKTKPTYLTEAEARIVAKRVVKEFHKNDRLFDSLKRIFYH